MAVVAQRCTNTVAGNVEFALLRSANFEEYTFHVNLFTLFERRPRIDEAASGVPAVYGIGRLLHIS